MAMSAMKTELPKLIDKHVQAMETLIAEALRFWSEDGTLIPFARASRSPDTGTPK